MIIAEVIPKEKFLLHIVSEDHQEGIFDVSPYLDSEAFSPLRENNNFQQVQNSKYFIEWKCGADLSADTIEARWKVLPNKALHGQAGERGVIFTNLKI